MLLAFLTYIVCSSLVVGALIHELRASREGARRERSGLEDRLMALTEPVAMTVLEGPKENGSIGYVPDEVIESGEAET